MIVVSDTTPIISLMKIHRLDLLNKLFGEVHIPKAVYDELTVNNRYIEESKTIENCEYIKKVRVADTKAVERLRKTTGLDIGESEAIVLSDALQSDFLLMDEVKGRIVAEQMGIAIMGTIGILMIANREDLLTITLYTGARKPRRTGLIRRSKRGSLKFQRHCWSFVTMIREM